MIHSLEILAILAVVPPAMADDEFFETLGSSRDGFGTKVHLVCDRHGFIVAIHVTAGQAHESKALEPTMARRLFHRRGARAIGRSTCQGTRVTAILAFADGVADESKR
jgi:Transposase DDE domain